MVPLAVLTEDPTIKAEVTKYLDYIIDHQDPDGWLGPYDDPWPRFPLLLAFQQMAEGYPTKANYYINSMMKFLQNLYKKLSKSPLESWAQFRWMDLGLALQWLSWHTKGNEVFLGSFFDLISKQGFDWPGFYRSSQFPKGPCLGQCQTLATHGVNNGQALKDGAVNFFRDGDKSHEKEFVSRLDLLDRYDTSFFLRPSNST